MNAPDAAGKERLRPDGLRPLGRARTLLGVAVLEAGWEKALLIFPAARVIVWRAALLEVGRMKLGV